MGSSPTSSTNLSKNLRKPPKITNLLVKLLKLEYFCDDKRHLVCKPFSVENLHRMADDLGIDRCWFHNKKRKPHYDIPKGRIQEIKEKCTVVHHKQIVRIILGDD